MSLPFLKRKDGPASAGIIIKTRAPDESSQDKDDPNASHEACARDLYKAIQTGDIKGISEALQDAFTLMDSEPHEEGPHINPHSYDAQNQKAGSDE